MHNNAFWHNIYYLRFKLSFESEIHQPPRVSVWIFSQIVFFTSRGGLYSISLFFVFFLVIKYTLKDRTRKFFAMRKIIGDRMCGSKKSNRHILKHKCAASSFIGQVICMDASNQKKVGRIYSTNERMFRSCYKCMIRGLIATLCQTKPYTWWLYMLYLKPYIICF